MEDLLTFVAVFAVLISILLIVTSASLTSFYNVTSAQKELLKTLKNSDVQILVEENGILVIGDKVVYVDINEGNITVKNVGTRDIFWVRLICWSKANPGNTVKLIPGEQNSTEYNSVPVLTIYAPYNEIAYATDKNKICVLVGRGFIRGFSVP